MIYVKDVFSTRIYKGYLPGWVSSTNRFTEEYYREQKENNPSDVLQTRNLTHLPELEYFCDYVVRETINSFSEQKYNVDLYNFYLKDLWGQEFYGGGYNFPHVHSNCVMVGLYFLKVPEVSPRVALSDPRPGKVMCELEPREADDHNVPFILVDDIKPGTVIFFNAWLTHNISMPRSSESLKFLHFNVSCEYKR
jgi:uncharacterized protein (TIGR02466 family)